MTDQELIARLLAEETDLTDCAADRIEELMKERDEARHLQSCACNYDSPTDVCMGHHALFERLYAAERAKLEARIEELERERDEALWQAKCHEETLDAWFDRRKLGHEAVDQAVVDAASGYLRTSRAGGMTKKQSDMILGVIQDMARLGLFADLFARAVLADLEKTE